MRRNHALWLGPLVAVIGFLTYWGLFARWPLTRDFPWVNLILLATALALSWVGLRRAWPGGGLRRAVGAAGLGLSALLTGVLVWYCFFLSYGLPMDSTALAVGEKVPHVRLVDLDGSEVDLAEGDGSRVIVFYRGFW